jgi:hypothetical protein
MLKTVSTCTAPMKRQTPEWLFTRCLAINNSEQKMKGRIIIKCSDTDLLVLCVHFFLKLKSTEQMWFLTETITNAKDNRRYIPVHKLSRSLSPTACQILPVAYALTGCDTTSSLNRIGGTNPYSSCLGIARNNTLN